MMHESSDTLLRPWRRRSSQGQQASTWFWKSAQRSWSALLQRSFWSTPKAISLSRWSFS